MRWPFVSRVLFEEVSRQRDEYKRELHRFQDIVAKQNWGEQIHDTIPVLHKEVAPVPEPIPEAQATEEEMQDEWRQEQAQLAAIARTRKSQLPEALQKVMTNRLFRRAKAAGAKAPVAPAMPMTADNIREYWSKDEKRPEVKARFEQLKAETLKSIH